MRRILALLFALLVIAGAGCTKPSDQSARKASPPPVSDNSGGGY